MREMDHFEIIVAGNGLAGKIAAIAAAQLGYSVGLIGPLTTKTAVADGRTTALMDQSIAFLDALGIWAALAPKSAALKTMQIIDGTNRLIHAPTVPFRSADIGLSAFGYNFKNSEALKILDDRIDAETTITVIDAKIERAEIAASRATLSLDNGREIHADFVIAADGKKSLIREASGISVRTWSYPQTAIVLNFSHTIAHGNTSTEFHTQSGPFTQVPLPGMNSSLVWVQKPEDAAAFLALSVEDASLLVEKRMQSMLGKVTIEATVQAWPLSGMTAARFGKGPVALIGEAAHAFPPIGAQGLNLSLRDIQTLCTLLGHRVEGVAVKPVGDAFDGKRRTDIISRTASVDLLNRSLLSNFLPVQILRAAGLHVLGSLAPLRNLIMHEGVSPGSGFKSLPQTLREKISRKRA